MLSEVTKDGANIFLLDNPGLELHSDGQRDIKRFLEEKLPSKSQVIYVTHSPAMIDVFNLEQVRSVELRGDMLGTKIGGLAIKNSEEFDLLEPVRSAIGASLATSLILNELNILVEGAADRPLIEAAMHDAGDIGQRKIVVNGSLSETPAGFLVDFYNRSRLPFVVFVDADEGGRKIATELKQRGIAAERILELRSIVEHDGDYEIEDVLSPQFYLDAVRAEYPELAIELDQLEVGKRTRTYRRFFKEHADIGFNKRRVAERAKQMLLDGKGDEESEANLRKIGDKLKETLDKQIGVKPAATP
jgi:predicted ATP-dependent endonuclease of OLD family